MTNEQRVKMAKDWYHHIVLGEDLTEWRDNAIESIGFYQGSRQWDQAAKRLLESQGRPALTINRVMPIIHLMHGMQIKDRQELVLKARRGGAVNAASLGTAMIQHGMSTSDGYDALSDCFRDGCITGKGWVTLDRSFDLDPFNGDLEVECPNPLFVYEDPRNTRYNINHGEFIFRERTVTLNELRPYYPGRIDEISKAMTNDWSKEWVAKLQKVPGSGLTAIANVFDHNGYEGDSKDETTYSSDGRNLKAVVLRECWYKTKERVMVASLMMPDGGQRFTRITDTKEQERMKLFIANNPDTNLQTAEAVLPTLHLLTMVGDLPLKYEEDPLNGMTDFPYVRFAPYWLHGDAFGVVDNLKDPQREHNKMRSQALHMLNQSGNTGWIGGKPSAKGMAQIQNYGSTPGVYLNKEDFGNMLERIKPEQLSQGHMQLAEIAPVDMEKISGANPDLTGGPTQHPESGRAKRLRMEAGQTTMVPVLSNMLRTHNWLGRTLWNFLRFNDVYDPEEVLAVVDESIIESLGGIEAVVEIMNRWDMGNYSVQADTTPSSSTHREAMLEEVRAVAMFFLETGLQIPPDLGQSLVEQVLKMSSFPGRDKMIEMLQQAQLQPSPAGPQAGARPQTTERGVA
jgi:hypothetical protein